MHHCQYVHVCVCVHVRTECSYLPSFLPSRNNPATLTNPHIDWLQCGPEKGWFITRQIWESDRTWISVQLLLLSIVVFSRFGKGHFLSRGNFLSRSYFYKPLSPPEVLLFHRDGICIVRRPEWLSLALTFWVWRDDDRRRGRTHWVSEWNRGGVHACIRQIYSLIRIVSLRMDGWMDGW